LFSVVDNFAKLITQVRVNYSAGTQKIKKALGNFVKIIFSYSTLASEVKRADERKSLNVFPIVTSFLLSAGGNFGCDQKSTRPNLSAQNPALP
jgi:hypothetical protein